MTFADDALAAHSPSQLQYLMDSFVNAFTTFGLTISPQKIKILTTGNQGRRVGWNAGAVAPSRKKRKEK